jgi:hypothetical protein
MHPNFTSHGMNAQYADVNRSEISLGNASVCAILATKKQKLRIFWGLVERIPAMRKLEDDEAN